jgi:hypothetical protein
VDASRPPPPTPAPSRINWVTGSALALFTRYYCRGSRQRRVDADLAKISDCCMPAAPYRGPAIKPGAARSNSQWPFMLRYSGDSARRRLATPCPSRRCGGLRYLTSNGGANSGGASDVSASPNDDGANPNDGGGANPNDVSASPSGGVPTLDVVLVLLLAPAPRRARRAPPRASDVPPRRGW